jgi:tetratricopeptide (TPR) repeat protein
MAPEQLRDARVAGPACDVFALGAILYECLAGEPAFVGESPLEVLTKLETGAFVPLRRARPGVPRGLAQAIEKALAPDVAARFRDGAAFAAALDAPEPRGLRRGALAAGAGFVVVAGSAAGALVAFDKAPRPTAPSVAVVTSRTLDAEATKLAERAHELFKANDLDGAIATATRAIERDPNVVLAWTVRGISRLNLRDLGGAIKDLERATAIDPRSLAAWNGLSAAHLARGAFDAAIAAATRAIDIGSPTAVPYLVRAEARRTKNDLDGVIADFTGALSKEPNNVPALRARAFARADRGDKAGALDDFKRLVELAPSAANTPSIKKKIEELTAEVGR